MHIGDCGLHSIRSLILDRTYPVQVALINALMIVGAMRVGVHSLPLCHQHPCRSVGRHVTINEAIIDVESSIIHDHVTKSRGTSCDWCISDRSFPSNINVTPEWTEDMAQPRGKVICGEAIWMRKPPWLYE